MTSISPIFSPHFLDALLLSWQLKQCIIITHVEVMKWLRTCAKAYFSIQSDVM